MAYNLGNKCAKNCCKRTCLVQLIVEDVVTCFLRHSVLTYYLLSPHGVQIHSTDAAAGASVDRWRSSAALLLEAETPHYCKHFGGPKNQSFGNNSGKLATNPDQIRCTCTDQWATTFSKFGCDRLSGGTTGTWTRSTKPEFFVVVKTRRFFGNFPTADFHRIWPLHVNQCPLEMYWNGFRKLFVYGSFAQKTSKLTGVEQTPYSDQPAHGTHCRLCLLGVVVQGLRSFSGLWSTFLYDVCTLWGQSSSFSNFRIFA